MNAIIFTKNFYLDKKRKGIDKLQYSHVLDVINNIPFNLIKDKKNRLSLFNVSLLHDVLEDSKYTPSELQQILHLSNNDIDLIKLLSRNYNSNYIQNICNNKDALIVKLSDRISNLNDLYSWIKLRGLDRHNRRILQKYEDESKEFNKYINNVYVTSIDSPIRKQLEVIKQLESNINNHIYEYGKLPQLVENTITINAEELDDIQFTVSDVYEKSTFLQDKFPDFIDHLDNTIKDVKALIELKGIDYVNNKYRGINLNQKSYVEYIQNEISIELFNKLRSIIEINSDTPTMNLIKKIKSNNSNMSNNEIIKLISSVNKDEIKKLHDILLTIYDVNYDAIHSKVKKSLQLYKNVEVTTRPGKYKDFDSLFNKYISIKNKYRGIRFTEISDVIGFRIKFKNLSDLIDYTLDISSNTDFNIFRLKKYLGTNSPYQGINFFISDGVVNYEVQCVLDDIQNITDIQHDILYKSIQKLPNNDKKSVVKLAKIAILLTINKMIEI